jgi:hypothetical protein
LLRRPLSFPALLCLLFVACGPHREPAAPPPAGTSVPATPGTEPGPRESAARVIDFYVDTYGRTDLSPLLGYLTQTKDVSPNDVVPLLSLGHAWLCRYERTRDAATYAKALDLLEIPARPDVWPAWGNRWASTITLSHLMKGVLRLRTLAPADPALAARVEALRARVATLAEGEADRKLGDDTPYRPYVSVGTGDTKAEENAWEAAFLAWVACLHPEHPHAAVWNEKARLLASLSIVRKSDRAFFKGAPVITVGEDFTLENHGLSPNPYYGGATIILLRMGALAYRMTGRAAPAEFDRNVEGLYRTYLTYCVRDAAGRWVWNRPADPVGDPAIWPFPGLDDDAYFASLVRQKLADGALWLPTPPVATLVADPEKGLTPDSVLGRAIQNGKVLWYYLDSAYLWLGTEPSPGPR